MKRSEVGFTCFELRDEGVALKIFVDTGGDQELTVLLVLVHAEVVETGTTNDEYFIYSFVFGQSKEGLFEIRKDNEVFILESITFAGALVEFIRSTGEHNVKSTFQRSSILRNGLPSLSAHDDGIYLCDLDCLLRYSFFLFHPFLQDTVEEERL